MNEKPMECPVCGQTDDVVVERKDCYGCEIDYYVVKCDGCGLQFGFGLEFEGEEEAVEAWNCRAQHMPTVDAVEVVRCRDCVHFGECLVTENDYCSKGERKEK